MRWDIAAPATAFLVYRSYSHGSLTPLGNLTAALTAIIHALHPSPLPFTLLVFFFLIGTSATKIKKEIKANLTLPSTGSHSRTTSSAIGDVFSGGWNKSSDYHEQKQRTNSNPVKPNNSVAGGQEPRSAIQVLANSGCVSLLCLLQVWLYGVSDQSATSVPSPAPCFGSWPARDLILVGIIANYASVTADTLSSELGILSSSKPRLILNPTKGVPPGTNGGVTGAGLVAGLAGALAIGLVSVLIMPKPCGGNLEDIAGLVLAVGAWGALGSVLDSIMGALFQASVIDKRSGKVVEAPNGGRVKYIVAKEKDDSSGKSNPSRMLGTGRDILDNNQVNLLMASIMTVGGMIAASQALGLPLSSLITGK